MTSRPRQVATEDQEGTITYRMAVDSTPGKPFGDHAKPTLLAFHGSGSNSMCHRVQLARLNMVLKGQFNIVILEAPFPSPAGPGILPFFEGCGPFARWLPPTEKVSIAAMRQGSSSNAMAPEVESLIRSIVQSIRAQGGRVVGLIGFSQGTKVVAGLLKATEIRRAIGTSEEDWCDFGFGVSICPSYPPPITPPLISALLEKSDVAAEEKARLVSKKVEMPSFLVLGKQDEWKWAGDSLIEQYYEIGEGKSVVNEWEMGHQYPALPEESDTIAKWIVDAWKKSEASGS